MFIITRSNNSANFLNKNLTFIISKKIPRHKIKIYLIKIHTSTIAEGLLSNFFSVYLSFPRFIQDFSNFLKASLMATKLLGGFKDLRALALTAVNLLKSPIVLTLWSIKLLSAALCHVFVVKLCKIEDTGSSQLFKEG